MLYFLVSKVSLTSALNALVALEGTPSSQTPSEDDVISADDLRLALVEMYARLPNAEDLADVAANMFLNIYDRWVLHNVIS